MAKITFMGAGSTIFAKNILGDCMLTPALHDSHMALYDIDAIRLEESRLMLDALNRNINKGSATITTHLGVEHRQEALKDSKYVINAIQVGGYEPCTVTDFEIPKKYGLRQTIGDTVGIGGIFRALRTIPVMNDFAGDMKKVCPDAWLLNYTNPMSVLTGYMLRHTGVKTVGLCHSVQPCAKELLRRLDMLDSVEKLQWKIAGINHQAWLLEVTDGGRDLYPEIKNRAAEMNRIALQDGAEKHDDMIRFEMMLRFGYYITESSEHSAEYMPYWVKNRYPELIEKYNIPLDEYPRRCIKQINEWNTSRDELVDNPALEHKKTDEYGSGIIEAMETDVPCMIGGNVLNTGNLIANLPHNCCVEVPCLVDRNGVQPVYVGDIPEQCAALNRTMINTEMLTIEAAVTGKRDMVYQAAMLDPHTSSELSLDRIVDLCDELIEAHDGWIPGLT